jgi:hypothetical protein
VSHIAGAQYDGTVQKWNRIEDAARRQRLGIWGQKQNELPSDYKRKMKALKKSSSSSSSSSSLPRKGSKDSVQRQIEGHEYTKLYVERRGMSLDGLR